MTGSQKGGVLVGALVATVLLALFLTGPWTGPARDAEPAAPARPPARNSEQAPSAAGGPAQSAAGDLGPPSGDRMTLTVPALPRVTDIPVVTAPGAEEGPLRDGAMHVEGTGFPWQEGANVYIAGHRLGFPGTRSDRLFWDLDELETGDRVVLEDADGHRYEYAVFRRKIVGPRQISVARPVPGKSVVSLQTCTLPDYSERLVVQAALVYRPGQASGERKAAG